MGTETRSLSGNHLLMLDCMYCFIRKRWFHWTAEEVEPLLVHAGSDEGSGREPFFTEIILVPLQSCRGRFYCGLYAGYDHARKEDWLEWIDWLFTPGQGPEAMAKVAVSHGIPEVGIWLMLPYPPAGKYLYDRGWKAALWFDEPANRLAVLQEAVETIHRRWLREWGHLPVKLRGVVWGREGMPEEDGKIVPEWNEWVAGLGLERLWLANYRSARVAEWHQLSFSGIALFSNYTGNAEYGPDWLENAGKFAALNGMGIQLVNGKGIGYDRDHPALYAQMARSYVKQGGKGPFVYTFPHFSLLDLYRENRQAYEALFALKREIESG